jgi:membrane-associated protease RseP (regulator of RpoE activity)
MWKGVLFVAAGLAAGFALAAWFATGTEPGPADPSFAGATETITPAAPAVDSERVTKLEQALAAETSARAALANKVEALTERLQTLAANAPKTPSSDDSAAPAGAGAPPPFARFRGFGGDSEEAQRREQEALAAAGFPPDRAEWIAKRESELRMQALQARYDAARQGKPFDPATAGTESTLRTELGDADYERYLQALNRPTTVAVRDVLASSPAEQAGLKPGDQVVSYDGQRVFDMRDLNALTLKGNAGEPVVVDVQREGQSVQLVLPRGPVGILGGGGRFGRP